MRPHLPARTDMAAPSCTAARAPTNLWTSLGIATSLAMASLVSHGGMAPTKLWTSQGIATLLAMASRASHGGMALSPATPEEPSPALFEARTRQWADAMEHPGGPGGAHPCRPNDRRPGRRVARPVFRKTVTNATSLRNMHVTLGMVDVLGLHEMEALPGKPTGAMSPPSTSQLLYKHVLMLRDTNANAWPVVYEATLSCRQCHRRLGKGWRDFCRHHGVQIGDSLEFERCLPCEPELLRVRVVRRHRRC